MGRTPSVTSTFQPIRGEDEGRRRSPQACQSRPHCTTLQWRNGAEEALLLSSFIDQSTLTSTHRIPGTVKCILTCSFCLFVCLLLSFFMTRNSIPSITRRRLAGATSRRLKSDHAPINCGTEAIVVTLQWGQNGDFEGNTWLIVHTVTDM